jgi:hypothetical protein
MKKWLVVLCAVLLSGWLFSLWGVDNRELGEGYYYLPEYEAIDIGGEPMVYKSAQREVFSDVKIVGDLRGVKANRRFIVAVRQPLAASAAGKAVPLKRQELQYFILVKASDTGGPAALTGSRRVAISRSSGVEACLGSVNKV